VISEDMGMKDVEASVKCAEKSMETWIDHEIETLLRYTRQDICGADNEVEESRKGVWVRTR
jgi:hypothetical protein